MSKSIIKAGRFGIFGILFLMLAFCSAAAKNRPVAVNGVMDLNHWDPAADGVVNLDGQWEFYWHRLLSPADFRERDLHPLYIQVPGYWDNFRVDGQAVGGTGFATFRLRLKGLKPGRILALDIPLMHTAYVLWADGRIISRNGVVGSSQQESVPRYLPKTPSFVPAGPTVEFVLQVSNFSHNNGGIWQTITLGPDTAVDTISQLRTAFDLFLLGAIFIMALYHFGLFALRHKEGSAMFFGLFCLIISFRLSIHGSTILSVLFPDISWELLIKLDYFVLYFGLIFFSAFLQSLYPLVFSRRALNLAVAVSAGFILFTLVVPASIFSAYLVYFQAVMGLYCLYYLYVLIRASIQKREGAAVMLGGVALLIITLVNDVLYNHEIIHTADLVGAGLFLMIFSQSFVLSMRFSRAFDTVEELSANLEDQVRERTAAIKDLLDNTGQGFFSFAGDFLVQRYTSRAVQDFFGKPIENEDALILLFQDGAGEKRDILDLVFSGAGDLDLVRELLPGEMEMDDDIYQIDYHWIPSQEKIPGRIMVVLTDITAQRDLENRLQEDEERNRMIVKIAVDRHGFLGFLKAIRQYMGDIRNMLDGPPERIEPDILFRHYHTVKGGLASYLFKQGAEKAHEIESMLEPVRNGQELLAGERMNSVKRETAELENIIEQTIKGLETVLPRGLLEAGDQNFFRIPEKKIQALETALSTSPAVSTEIKSAVQELRKQPMRNVLKKFAEDARELGQRLNKPVNVILQGEETEIVHDPFKPLFTSLIHLIRNAVDHGLEPADVRLMLDKPETGVISIQAGLEDANLVIRIADDGGGIDEHAVRKKAVEKGLITAEEADTLSSEDAIKLIFKPGFSTHETVSDLSGRGVGMDAVDSAVKALNGQIRVDSRPDHGTWFVLTLPIP